MPDHIFNDHYVIDPARLEEFQRLQPPAWWLDRGVAAFLTVASIVAVTILDFLGVPLPIALAPFGVMFIYLMVVLIADPESKQAKFNRAIESMTRDLDPLRRFITVDTSTAVPEKLWEAAGLAGGLTDLDMQISQLGLAGDLTPAQNATRDALVARRTELEDQARALLS